MRRTWRSALVGMAAVLATGAYAQTAQAQVYRGNDTGGIIPWSCENEAYARAIAGEFCAGYGKYARITSVHRIYGDYIGFNCLWRPHIARYQIPAVGTRKSCYAKARGPRLHPRVTVRY